MTVKIIALVTRNENAPEAFAKYMTATAPLLKAAGAKIVQVFEINEVIIGNRPAKTVFVVEYPDRAAVSKVFESPQYQDIIPQRDKAFLEYSVSLVCS